jgi:hypothetical protein
LASQIHFLSEISALCAAHFSTASQFFRYTDGAIFEVFKAMKTEVMVLWVVAPYSAHHTLQPEDGGIMLLQNTGIKPSHYMAQQSRKLQLLH